MKKEQKLFSSRVIIPSLTLDEYNSARILDCFQGSGTFGFSLSCGGTAAQLGDGYGLTKMPSGGDTSLEVRMTQLSEPM